MALLRHARSCYFIGLKISKFRVLNITVPFFFESRFSESLFSESFFSETFFFESFFSETLFFETSFLEVPIDLGLQKNQVSEVTILTASITHYKVKRNADIYLLQFTNFALIVY